MHTPVPEKVTFDHVEDDDFNVEYDTQVQAEFLAAARRGDITMCESYLLRFGVNVDGQDDRGDTALNIAAQTQNYKLLKVLLDYGANPKIKNYCGLSAEDHQSYVKSSLPFTD